MSAAPRTEAEERATESVARLRARLDLAVAEIKRLLDDIEATAERLAGEKGTSGDFHGR